MKTCPICGRMVDELFLLSAADIQRTKDTELLACGKCREEVRSASRLEVKYVAAVLLRDFTVSLALGVVAIILLTDILYTSRSSILGRQEDLYFMTILFVFTSSGQAWRELQHRYGSTHDLRWSLQSRRVVIPLGVLGSCLVILVLSMFVSLVSSL